jgi:hypothetical protein
MGPLVRTFAGRDDLPDRDEGTATMASAEESKSEYMTYAPSGETCPECKKPIGTFEPARRGMLARVSGPPAVVYRHAGRCPR